MNLNQAKRNITRAWLLSSIAVPLIFIAPLLGKLLHVNTLHLFLPWLFPGVLKTPLLVVVLVLTFMVYRKSRAAALLLFVFYIADRFFVMFFTLGYFDWISSIAWLCIAFLWGYVLAQGVRGTFAHHHLESDIASSESKT